MDRPAAHGRRRFLAKQPADGDGCDDARGPRPRRRRACASATRRIAPGRGQAVRAPVAIEPDAYVSDVAQPSLRVLDETGCQDPPHGIGRVRGQAVQSGSRSMTAASVSVVVAPPKAATAGEHLVEHAAERPDVGALVDRLTARLLGTHVGRGAEITPVAVPVIVWPVSRQRREAAPAGLAAFASPKSSTLTLPSGVILMLAGLRSR